MPICDHIVDNIYLGNFEATNDDVYMKSIDVIINLSNTRYTKNPSKKCYYLDITDSVSSKIEPLLPLFNKIIESTDPQKIFLSIVDLCHSYYIT